MPARLQPTLSYWPRPPHLASAKLDGRSRVRRNNYCRDAQQKAYNRDCMRSPIHGGNQDGVPLKSQWHPGYRFGKTATERDRRAREDYVRLGRMAVLLFEAALCVVRPITPRRIFVPLLLLLLLGASPARGVDLVDLTLYGGAFDSSSTIAYSEVVQTCFGGLEVGSCEPSSPNWLVDFLDQYNQGTAGAYCASCCSNTDVLGDTWTFTCPLISSAFADFVNHFGWEFRFGRRETTDDKQVITCAIPRTACVYDEEGVLSEPCEADQSFLSGYVLTVEVMTVERGLKSWKSVQGCSVLSLESDTQPEWLAETITMTQVYANGSGIEAGWATLIALVAFGILSCGVRYARDDRCVVCGHHLIWFPRVCLPCNFYGYAPPSKEVAEIISDKRAVVLPEPTLSERIGTVKASTTKVFVQATEGMIPSGTLSKISSIRNGTLGKSRVTRAAESRAGGDGSGEKRLGATDGGSVFGNSTATMIGGFRRMSGARTTSFTGDSEEDDSRSRYPVNPRWYQRILFWRKSSRVVASHATAQDGGGRSSSNDKNNGEGTGVGNARSKPKPLRRSPEWFIKDDNS